MQPVLITTTTGSKEEAAKISRLLVESKIAACVNIVGPITSIYTWQDKITEDIEFKLFIKTFKEKWKDVKNLIKENHSYSVPEISMIEIHDMQPDYLTWMRDIIK